MARARSSALVVALLVIVAACSGEPAGRRPPDEIRGWSDYARSGFHCERGTPPVGEVWYPPRQVVVVGADAVAADETRFQCPDYASSGSSDLMEVATSTSTLDLYIDGGADQHGVAQLRGLLYPPDDAPRWVEFVDLEPNWHRIKVPGAANGWIVRLDLVTELGWEASYAFRVTALQ